MNWNYLTFGFHGRSLDCENGNCIGTISGDFGLGLFGYPSSSFIVIPLPSSNPDADKKSSLSIPRVCLVSPFYVKEESFKL